MVPGDEVPEGSRLASKLHAAPTVQDGALPHFDVTGMMVSKYDDNWEELFSG